MTVVAERDGSIPEAIVISGMEMDNLLPPLPEGERFYLHDWMFPPVQTTNALGQVIEEPPKPWFSVSEVAKMWFGRGADWLRWRMKPTKDHPYGYFTLDGVPLPERRIKNSADPSKWHRYFTLADIERMAHALAQNGGMDARELWPIIVMAVMCAHVNGVRLVGGTNHG